MLRAGSLALGVSACLALGLWSSDAITLDGERTVYTADCHGAWQGRHCMGDIAAGSRFHFKAAKDVGEVTFHEVGAAGPREVLRGCAVRDGRNWRCDAGTATVSGVAWSMVNGRADAAAPGGAAPFHVVSKWRWWLLRWHLASSDAATG